MHVIGQTVLSRKGSPDILIFFPFSSKLENMLFNKKMPEFYLNNLF